MGQILTLWFHMPNVARCPQEDAASVTQGADLAGGAGSRHRRGGGGRLLIVIRGEGGVQEPLKWGRLVTPALRPGGDLNFVK